MEKPTVQPDAATVVFAFRTIAFLLLNVQQRIELKRIHETGRVNWGRTAAFLLVGEYVMVDPESPVTSVRYKLTDFGRCVLEATNPDWKLE